MSDDGGYAGCAAWHFQDARLPVCLLAGVPSVPVGHPAQTSEEDAKNLETLIVSG